MDSHDHEPPLTGDPGPQPTVDPPAPESAPVVARLEPVKVPPKPPRRTCIFLFVSALLAFTAIGEFPISLQWNPGGDYFFFARFIPMMTYTGAVYSLLFLFRPRKNFALLSGGYKVLAIISATILNLATAYSILLIVLVSTGRIHNHMIVGTNRNDAIGLQGAETWTVDGSEWKITATYFMGNGHRLMYVIECQYPNPIAIKSREEAVQIYFPLVRHAIQNRRHERWKELKPPPALDLTYVGVVLVKWHGIQYEKYSDSISLAEIQARLAGFDGSLQNPEHLTSHGLQLRQ